MASSKTFFLLLCAIFALVFILSSEVSPLDAEEEPNNVGESKQYGGGYGGPGVYGGGRGGKCRYGCCRGYRYKYGCKKCCASANEAPDSVFEDDVKN